MATTAIHLLTVEEFQKVPNPPGGVYELLHGELNFVGYPDIVHTKAQRYLWRTLDRIAEGNGVVEKELPYRPVSEHECWAADIAYISQPRWDAIDRWLQGPPELVIEILSPSNSAGEMYSKEQICLENGAREFWTVDTKRKTVRVVTADGHQVTYKPGQQIPIFFAPGQSIAVDAIFE